MATAITSPQPTVREVERLLKAWGFSWSKDLRRSTEYSHPNYSQTITLKKGRTSLINQFQISEIVNLLNVTREQFFAGPPEEYEPLQAVPDLPDPQIAEAIAAKWLGPNAQPQPEPPKKPVFETRTRLIEYLDSVGGTIKDEAGFASRQLLEPSKLNQPALSSMLRAMEADEQIIRSIKGKRCFEIVLNTDNNDVQWVLKTAVRVSKPAQLEPLEEPPTPLIEIPQAVVEQFIPQVASLSTQDYDAIAEAIVRGLLVRLSRVDREAALEARVKELEGRLARTIEYAQGLRRDRERLLNK